MFHSCPHQTPRAARYRTWIARGRGQAGRSTHDQQARSGGPRRLAAGPPCPAVVQAAVFQVTTGLWRRTRDGLGAATTLDVIAKDRLDGVLGVVDVGEDHDVEHEVRGKCNPYRGHAADSTRTRIYTTGLARRASAGRAGSQIQNRPIATRWRTGPLSAGPRLPPAGVGAEG